MVLVRLGESSGLGGGAYEVCQDIRKIGGCLNIREVDRSSGTLCFLDPGLKFPVILYHSIRLIVRCRKSGHELIDRLPDDRSVVVERKVLECWTELGVDQTPRFELGFEIV